METADWNPTNEMMIRFTQRAKQALSFAREDAARLQHGVIGPEHLLLGLSHEGGGVAGRVLRELGLDVARIEEAVSHLASSTSALDSPQLSFTTVTKQALESAVDQANHLEHRYIGTEHLLLGLIGQPDSSVIRILDQFGVKPDTVRDRIFHIFEQSKPSAG